MSTHLIVGRPKNFKLSSHGMTMWSEPGRFIASRARPMHFGGRLTSMIYHNLNNQTDYTLKR